MSNETRSTRVLLVAPAASYRIGAYVAAASNLGIELSVGSSGEHSLVAEVARGVQIPLDDVASATSIIATEHERRPFAAVLASDDATVELAIHVAHALGLAQNPVTSARIARRKDLARAAQARAGIPVPWFVRIDLYSELQTQLSTMSYPCVLKPLALSGSRGVMRADDQQSLLDNCARVREILRRQGALSAAAEADTVPEELRYALVEQFIVGIEIAVEAILVDGELELIAIFDKPEPLDGPYFEESYYIMPSRLSAQSQQRVQARVAQMCRAYGLVNGPVHAEFRIGSDEIWPLELASRTIGGDCARLLQFGAGHGLEELVLARAVGIPLDVSRSDEAGGVLMIPIPRSGVLRRVEGVLAAEKVALVDDVYIAAREGHELHALPEGNSYLGFVFARGPTSASVEAALREAHACLKIVIAPMWRIDAVN